MNTRSTTGENLQRVLLDNLATIDSVKLQSKEGGTEKSISPEQFKSDLDFYMESGIFANSLDFKYEYTGENTIIVKIGNLSCYCDNCITVNLAVNDNFENLEKYLKKKEVA